MISFLTKGLNIHLNFGQSFIVTSSPGFLSLETMTIESLLNKQMQLVGGAHIGVPSRFNSSFNHSTRNSLRVCSLLKLLSVGKISFILDDIETVSFVW